jgi:tRNA pseudouridine13 synthase
MKLKQRPDDFQVEEVSTFTPGSSGPYAYYRLEKRSIGTAEAIQKVCKQLHIDPRRLRYGGLKDRHAVTIQYVTIEDGPHRHLRDTQLHLRYLGQVEEHYGPQSFTGNRFSITLRDLDKPELEQVEQALEEVRQSLIGNYFDDQRFGSVSPEGRFVARCLIEGKHEEALKLALSSPYEFDRSAQKKTKQGIRKKWGRWAELLPEMPPGQHYHIVSFLVHQPDNFRGAFAKIPFFLRNMYLSAYQSHLWNRILSKWMASAFSVERLVAVHQKSERIPMPRQLSDSERDQFKAVSISLPSARLKTVADDPMAPFIGAVMAEEGIALQDLKLKHYKEPFFSRGERPAFYFPAELKSEIGWDKWNKGHRKLKLMFTLPRGSYATLLVKRITAISPWRN